MNMSLDKFKRVWSTIDKDNRLYFWNVLNDKQRKDFIHTLYTMEREQYYKYHTELTNDQNYLVNQYNIINDVLNGYYNEYNDIVNTNITTTTDISERENKINKINYKISKLEYTLENIVLMNKQLINKIELVVNDIDLLTEENLTNKIYAYFGGTPPNSSTSGTSGGSTSGTS